RLRGRMEPAARRAHPLPHRRGGAARRAPRLAAALSMSVRFADEVRTALSNMAWKVVSLPLDKVCRLALGVAAGRTLGTAGFGRFRFATTVTLMLAMVMDLGL